ncbi:MAG: DNA mismatch repair protein MutL, partial [Halobacteria archaeon]|nr:DNA mismatch repair protein MutL [Halobacteria archaeon]
MVTKPSDSDGVGATRVVTGPSHDEPETERAGRGVGTTVEVSEIFADTPARRKSLGTPNQEFSEISDVVTHYALVHPEVGFDLEHDGRTVLSTPGSDDYVDPLFGAYGREVANRGV